MVESFRGRELSRLRSGFEGQRADARHHRRRLFAVLVSASWECAEVTELDQHRRHVSPRPCPSSIHWCRRSTSIDPEATPNLAAGC